MGKVLLAMAAGYLLGRKKKAKLATALGMWLVIKKLDVNPQQLLTDLKKELSDLPVVDEIRGEAREELAKAARSATSAVVSQVAGNVADSLSRRTERLLHTDRSEEGEPAEEGGPERGNGSEEEPAEDNGAEAEEGPAEDSSAEVGEEPPEGERTASGRGRGPSSPPRGRGRSSPPGRRKGAKGGDHG